MPFKKISFLHMYHLNDVKSNFSKSLIYLYNYEQCYKKLDHMEEE